MKQVLRKGLKNIVVEEVPEPLLQPHHVLIRPAYSLISSGTETASLHQEGVVAALRHNPSHLQKVAAAAKTAGVLRTFSEVRAKFSEYAVLGYSGAGRVTEVHPTVPDIEAGQSVAFGGEGSGHAETVRAGRHLIVPVPGRRSVGARLLRDARKHRVACGSHREHRTGRNGRRDRLGTRRTARRPTRAAAGRQSCRHGPQARAC